MKNILPSELKEALKNEMKRQGKSYYDLAAHLNVSHVTVKRFMSKEELSMSRFLEICNWLEVSIGDLEKIIATDKKNEKIRFTEKQEEFLAKNPQYLSFLFNMYTDETPEKIQKKFGLSKKSLDLYLLRLEKYDLIKKVGRAYKPTYSEFPSPIPYGALIRTQFEKVLSTGYAFFKRQNHEMIVKRDPEFDKGKQILLSVFEVSKKSYLAWLEKHRELYDELVRTATAEEKMTKLKDKKAVVMMHMHGLVEINDFEVDSIKNMFGKVVEL